MLSSISDNTYKQYNGCIRTWIHYCSNNGYDYENASVSTVINFWAHLFDSGAKYGTINNYRSALSLLLGKTLASEKIKRFMKGVFRLRPTAPKYNLTWDPSIVLNYLAQKWPNEDLDLKTLSKKTLTLLALATAHRVQTFSLIRLKNIHMSNSSEIIIKIPDLIKTSRPNSLQPVLRLPYFDEKPEICPARCIEAYINKTNSLRAVENDTLFISFRKPHSKLSSQRLSHWIKETLCKSGIDTSVFTAHSTRHSSTSAANQMGVSLDIIRKTAGWSQSSCIFAKFYNKEIVNDCNQFARVILSSTMNPVRENKDN
jgi:hypothetical protein